MGKSILAIGTLVGRNQKTQDIIVTSNSLQTSGLDFGLTMDAIRGGIGNMVQGYLPHTSSLDIKLEDSLFDLNYMALNCGGSITANADVMKNETVTTTAINTITVNSTPVAPNVGGIVYGWYKLSTSTEDSWTTITFSGKNATVTALPSGSTVCVKYFYADPSSRGFKVSSNFIPSIIDATITYKLYKTGDTISDTTVIGELQVRIPSFQFSGAQSYSISASGATSSPISGSALSVSSGSCDGSGYYALINEVLTNADPLSNVTSIMIEGSLDGFDLAVAGTEMLNIYAKYNNGTSPSKLPNNLFTFTSSVPAKATVGANTGLVTGVATGTTVVSVVATAKPSLETNCEITVA